MISKVFKILKIFISLVIIFSYALSTYAAFVATDGSSFVTKAEFDGAMADFNSRLTIFEAGINSKIDSQVTSYLDRNGIWSAKSQKLNNSIGESRTVWLNPLNSLSATSGSISYNIQSAITPTSTTMSTESATARYIKLNQRNEDDYIVCENIDKAGLCYVDFTYSSIFNMDGLTSSYLSYNTTDTIQNWTTTLNSNYALMRFATDYKNATAANKPNIKLANYVTTENNPNWDGMGIYANSPNAAQSFSMVGFLQFLETLDGSTTKNLKTSKLVFTRTTPKKQYPIANSRNNLWYSASFNFGGTIDPINTNVTFFVSRKSKVTVRISAICSGRGWNTFAITSSNDASRKSMWLWGVQINELSVY